MGRAQASGFTLDHNDVPIILGMLKRGDRDHDIAAWFGVNQGRIKDAKDGKYGSGQPAPSHTLPPKGAPGVKGKFLREDVDMALEVLQKDKPDVRDAIGILLRAKRAYDRHDR
jgi:hypothetical protein